MVHLLIDVVSSREQNGRSHWGNAVINRLVGDKEALLLAAVVRVGIWIPGVAMEAGAFRNKEKSPTWPAPVEVVRKEGRK